MDSKSDSTPLTTLELDGCLYQKLYITATLSFPSLITEKYSALKIAMKVVLIKYIVSLSNLSSHVLQGLLWEMTYAIT